jgi:hypothetical protein
MASSCERLMAGPMRDTANRRAGRTVRAFWLAIGLLSSASCGGGGGTPTGPAPGSSLPVSIRVSPFPLRATFVKSEAGTSTYRFTADVTVSESRGIGVQITQLRTTTMTRQQTEQGFLTAIGLSQSTPVALSIPARGAETQSHVVEFRVAVGETVTWSFAVSGVDAEGRTFFVSTGDMPVELITGG